MDYKNFFGFKESPFHLTPDPSFFFPSDAHREALQTLLYSIRAGEGFVQITGDPGTGKTLLIRTILRELGDDISTALIFNPRLSPHELLRTLLEDLGLDPHMMENLPREDLLRRFRDFLLSKAEHGQRVIVIIDEAQNLPMDTLEELRLLSNLETEKEKLLQIILVGQRELEDKLDLPEVRQLHQRITIRYQLDYLKKDDIRSYIYHRLKVATPEDQDITVKFTPKALTGIYRLSKGIPRLINIISERSIMAAYVEGKKTITIDEVKKAMESIRGNDSGKGRGLGKTFLSVAAVFFLVTALGIFGAWTYKPDIFQSAGLFKSETVTTSPAVDPVLVTQETSPPAVRDIVLKKSEDTEETADETPAPQEDEPAVEPADIQFVSPDQPPMEAFSVAHGAYFVRVIIESSRVQIWRGTDSDPVLTGDLEFNWPYGQGLFLAGYDQAEGNYVFNHKAFLRGNPTTVPSTFFNLIQDKIEGNAVPVIAVVRPVDPDQDQLQKVIPTRQVFESFITKWEEMRIDELFNLYGRVVSNHYLDQPRPIVLSREQSYERKNDVFRRSSFINIGVSKPVFIMDPTDSENVMAAYHQEYRSRIWQDEGTKVLYLSLQDTTKGREWKVAAELWVADLPAQP